MRTLRGRVSVATAGRSSIGAQAASTAVEWLAVSDIRAVAGSPDQEPSRHLSTRSLR